MYQEDKLVEVNTCLIAQTISHACSSMLFCTLSRVVWYEVSLLFRFNVDDLLLRLA